MGGGLIVITVDAAALVPVATAVVETGAKVPVVEGAAVEVTTWEDSAGDDVVVIGRLVVGTSVEVGTATVVNGEEDVVGRTAVVVVVVGVGTGVDTGGGTPVVVVGGSVRAIVKVAVRRRGTRVDVSDTECEILDVSVGNTNFFTLSLLRSRTKKLLVPNTSAQS